MAQYGYPNPHKDPKTLPKKKEKEKTTWREIAAKFSGGPEGKDRRTQFQSYMSMIDRLQKQKFYFRNQVRARNPSEQLIAQAGQIHGAKTTKMSTILDKYHDKALRLAQAKYYQKQTG